MQTIIVKTVCFVIILGYYAGCNQGYEEQETTIVVNPQQEWHLLDFAEPASYFAFLNISTPTHGKECADAFDRAAIVYFGSVEKGIKKILTELFEMEAPPPSDFLYPKWMSLFWLIADRYEHVTRMLRDLKLNEVPRDKITWDDAMTKFQNLNISNPIKSELKRVFAKKRTKLEDFVNDFHLVSQTCFPRFDPKSKLKKMSQKVRKRH